MDHNNTSPMATNHIGTTKVNLGGVSIHYSPQHSPDTATIDYTGILHNSGATGVYLRTGTNNEWKNIYDYPMYKTVSGWQTQIPVQPNQTINFCFKDSANNWDNNNQHNWSLTLATY